MNEISNGLGSGWALGWTSVADRVIGRDNNFNVMRFVAASLVVLSHSYALSGHGAEEPLARTVGILDFATLAVITFFVISGFLVTRSAHVAPTLGSFVGLVSCASGRAWW